VKRESILIVDDDKGMQTVLTAVLGSAYETSTAGSGEEALGLLNKRGFDLVLLDMNLPDMGGIDVLRKIKAEVYDDTCVIVISALDTARSVLDALRHGAADYVTKPFETDALMGRVAHYLEGRRLKREITFIKEELQERIGYQGIVTRSAKMQSALDTAKKVSATSSSVLITGESGTGKELVARCIHELSERRSKPFVAINCGAMPAELMESEIFGYEKGAFTGATKARVGKFEYADGGTVFLDEIANMPLSLQAKLLRVIQERTFERVGANRTIEVDIRFIVATNADLMLEVKKGAFRDDLFYRLNVVPIKLPPLRERHEDIELLSNIAVETYAKKFRKNIPGISPEALTVLKEYEWPGNVRELQNIMERLVVLGQDGANISAADIPSDFKKKTSAACAGTTSGDTDLKEACRRFEKEHITSVLESVGWSRTKAAAALGVHRNTLLNKMQELGIGRESSGGLQTTGNYGKKTKGQA